MRIFFRSLAFKRALFLTIGIFVATFIVGAAVGIWYGPSSAPVVVEQTPVSCALSLDESVTLKDVLKDIGYKAFWISKEDVALDIQVKDNNGVFSADEEDGVLAYEPKTRTFTAIGIGEGTVKFTSKSDSGVTLTIPFRVDFDSAGTAELVQQELADGKLTQGEISSIESLKTDIEAKSDAPVSVSDLRKFPNLKELHLTTTEAITYFTDLGEVGALDFFVPEALYDAYMIDPAWSTYRNFIFPDLKDDEGKDVEGDFTVTYNGNGGTFDDVAGAEGDRFYTKVDKGTVLKEQDVSIYKTGYTLEGWYQDIDGADSEATRLGLAKVAEGNLKYHAKWREHQYTLKFNTNGGSGSISDKTLYFTESFTPDENRISYTGYTFLGWSKTPTGNVEYTPGHKFESETPTDKETITLYAKWGINDYTVVYHDDAGAELKRTNLTYGQRAQVYEYTASKTGYHFAGWSRSVNSSTATYAIYSYISNLSAVDGAVVDLYPVWVPNTYSVNYFATGASNVPSTSYNVKYGEYLKLPTEIPEAKGRTFLGWSMRSTAATPTYTAGQSVLNLTAENNGIVALYAVWEAEEFTIVFNSTGSESGSSKTATVEYGDPYSITTTLKKTGYYIAGWGYTANASLSGAFDGSILTASNIDKLYDKAMESSNKTVQLYPIWAEITYDVEYDLKGGSGTSSDQTNKKYTESFKLHGAPTKEGYTFLGWGTKSTATTATYSANQSVSKLTSDNDDTIKLYAVWKANEFKITFNGNGGGSNQTVTATYDESVSIPGFTRDGYTLLGWATSATATTARYTSTSVMSASNVNRLYPGSANETVTVYAVWKQNEAPAPAAE